MNSAECQEVRLWGVISSLSESVGRSSVRWGGAPGLSGLGEPRPRLSHFPFDANAHRPLLFRPAPALGRLEGTDNKVPPRWLRWGHGRAHSRILSGMAGTAPCPHLANRTGFAAANRCGYVVPHRLVLEGDARLLRVHHLAKGGGGTREEDNIFISSYHIHVIFTHLNIFILLCK